MKEPPSPAGLDIYGAGPQTRRAVWWTAEETPFAAAAPSPDRPRGALTCWGHPQGDERWTLALERQGLRTIAILSSPCFERSASTHDPLWTLGTLGRQGDAAREAPAADAALRWRVGAPWPRLRLLVDDARGELWGSLEATPAQYGAFALRTWDGRALVHLAVHRLEDDQGIAFDLHHAAPRDALERAAVEAAGLAVILLNAGPPPG